MTGERALEGFTMEESNVDITPREDPLHHAFKHKLVFYCSQIL